MKRGRPGLGLDAALLRYYSWMGAYDGVPPTAREFAMWCGLAAPSAGFWWMSLLTEAGYLRHAVPTRRKSTANDLVLTYDGLLRVDALTRKEAS